MICTSLGIAPAVLIAQQAEIVLQLFHNLILSTSFCASCSFLRS
jgi:hypothetical protein